MGGVKVFDATRDPRGRGVTPWLHQLAALAFVGETQRLHGIDWQFGQLASLDFSAGGMRNEGDFPVTDSRVWPRGDFAFSADGRRVAAPLQRDPGIVGVWDVALGRLATTIRETKPLVTAVAFSPDGMRLATGALDKQKKQSVVTLWDLASGRAILTVDVGPNTVECVALAGDGRKLAAGGGGVTTGAPGWVTVWGTETGEVLGAPGRVGLATYVAFHPDGESLAVADHANRTVILWDLATGMLIKRPGPPEVSCVAFTPDGKRLASLGNSGNIHLADARTGEEMMVLRSFGPPHGSGGWTPRVAFSADGSRIAAHMSNFLNLWEARPLFDPPVEPKPDDVLGWLRRSRSSAARGDDAQALAAFERALASPADLPEPWIRHGLAEGIEPGQAQMAFTRAFKVRCDDPLRWLECARELERSDRKHEAAIALERARRFAEKRLTVAPDDEPAAWVLADLLKDEMTALSDGNWVILVPSDVTSAGGARMTRLPDGSILASGANPVQDSVTLVARTELTGITGLRLEVLPDPNLPAHGPGRHYVHGDLHLTELSAAVAPGDDRSRIKAIVFDKVIATNVLTGGRIASPSGVEGGNRLTRWDVRGQLGQRNAIAWATADPVDAPAGSTWIIRLDCLDARTEEGTLGRFRLSVTKGPVTLFETSLHKTLTEPEWNGRTRLGVVYYLRGDWQAAALALRTAADGPDGTGTDRFLLALALHHLGLHDEARGYLASGVDWLKQNRNSGTLRTLVVEAVAVIEGASRAQAEARMFLDAIFPGDAFAR
jgi:tetratricopeptide (TPR) repeat protein